MFFAAGLTLVSACLHASWNAIAHRRRDNSTLVFRLPLIVGVAGIVPVVLAEIQEPLFNWRILLLLAVTGLGQSFYYFGLRRAYAASEFAIAYPLSRAMPVLVLAAFDAARGHPVGFAKGVGMAIVGVGCLLTPLKSLRDFSLKAYATTTTFWVSVIALGAIISMIADKVALEMLPRRVGVSVRYGVWEAIAALPFLMPMMRRERGTANEGLGWAIVAAAFSYGSYALVLAAYQFTDHTSIVAALRQLSVPIGVALSSTVLKEPPARMRWIAAGAIAVGVACVVAGA